MNRINDKLTRLGIALGSGLVILAALLLSRADAQTPPPNPNPGAVSVLGGYAPVAAGTSSARVAMPVSGLIYRAVTLFNSGSVDAYYNLGGSSVAATTSNIKVKAGTALCFWIGGNTYIAAITASSSTTLDLYQANGCVSFAGGGSSGGGGGGGGAITAASGSYAASALSAGAGVDGWDLTQGAKADAACTTDIAACSLTALLKRTNQNLTTLNTTAGGSVPAGTNLIGKFGIDQTTPGTTNLVAAGQNGSWTVQPGNTANTTPWLVTPAAGITGGTTSYHLVAANTTNATGGSSLAGAHVIYSIQTGNISSTAPAYLKFYDKATAPTCNTDPVVKTIIIPANSLGGGNNVSMPVGSSFTSGIGFCITAGIADNDNTAVAAATVLINFGYK